ncbi:hypothetical protein CPC08DRAFT_768347 [Agrocybe pediades]|nr:hypothetical protein CPC08DRAFT_768347 [Agrocybe pediades]
MDGSLVFEEDFDDEGLKYFENLVLNVVLPQTLVLSVKFTIHDLQDAQTAEALIKKRLPGLHARNLLEFDAKVELDEHSAPVKLVHVQNREVQNAFGICWGQPGTFERSRCTHSLGIMSSTSLIVDRALTNLNAHIR